LADFLRLLDLRLLVTFFEEAFAFRRRFLRFGAAARLATLRLLFRRFRFGALALAFAFRRRLRRTGDFVAAERRLEDFRRRRRVGAALLAALLRFFRFMVDFLFLLAAVTPPELLRFLRRTFARSSFATGAALLLRASFMRAANALRSAAVSCFLAVALRAFRLSPLMEEMGVARADR
jgi:hypothetical protein